MRDSVARKIARKAYANSVEALDLIKGHVYGVKRSITATSSTWERIYDSTNLVANATKDGTSVSNDFDVCYPWKNIISFNLDLSTGQKVAFLGDSDFKFDGTNGDVYTYIPEFWYKIYEQDGYMYILIADFAKAGFIKSESFDVARYLTGLASDSLRSYSGITPAVNKTLPQFRALARALGTRYGLIDWKYFILQILYLVEYADFNTQLKLGNGMTSMRCSNDDKALVAETATNRIIINTSGASSFVVGQTISIGTGTGNFSVADGRKVVSKTPYSEGEITGTAVIFDGDAIDVALNNVVWSSPQHSGSCDSLGMKSGCLLDDNKHAVVYRGIENWFGNVWQWVDSINIKDNQAWICYNPENYVCDKFEAPYKELGYVNGNTNGYTSKLGFDANNPLVQFPEEVGAGSTTGTCDYYYQNTGNRVARVGGALDSGASAGAFCWNLSISSSTAGWGIGARVLRNQ